MGKLSLICAIMLLAGCAHMKDRAIPFLNGDCPAEYNVKGNDGRSDYIYHTRNSQHYNSVNAEWCFKSEKAAKRFGYRRFRVMHNSPRRGR